MNKLYRTIPVRGIVIKTINRKHNKQEEKYQFPLVLAVRISFDIYFANITHHILKTKISRDKRSTAITDSQVTQIPCTPHYVQTNLSG